MNINTSPKLTTNTTKEDRWFVSLSSATIVENKEVFDE